MGVFEAMRLLEDNYLGGSGSRGFGKVKFTNISITKEAKIIIKKTWMKKLLLKMQTFLKLLKVLTKER